MKLSSNILFLAFCLLALPFVACHKADDHSDDATDPVVSITSPAEAASLKDSVTIAGLVTDNNLHELEMKITKDADGSSLWEASPTVHDLTEYAIAETWTPSGITAATPVTLTIIAEDHNDHKVTQTVHFVVNP